MTSTLFTFLGALAAAGLGQAEPPGRVLTGDAGALIMMDTIRHVLIDVETNTRVANWSLTAQEATPKSRHRWRVEKDVLHGGKQEGVDRIRVDNGVLSFTIIPSRGMSLWDGKAGDVRLGWDSPVKEIVHPGFINLSERGGLGWLEGFGEWVNRCGLASNGAPGEDRVPSNTGALVPVQLTLHGKVSYLPARRVEVIVNKADGELAEIIVRGGVDEAMMFGTHLRLVTEISTRAGSSSVTIRDEIENLAATPQEFQILYHANFGSPLLQGGARVIAPALRVTPRDAQAARGDMAEWSLYGPPTAGYQEQVYFLELAADARGRTEVLLQNATGDRGASMTFSKRELPHFTVWKNTQAIADGYVTGLEPATNFPNNRSFERQHGRVPVLKPGEAHAVSLTITAHLDASAVTEAAKRVEALLGEAKTRIDPQPVAGLSP